MGQGIGHRRADRAVRSAWDALGLGVAFMSLTALAYLLLPRAIMGVYTSDPGVLDLGARLRVHLDGALPLVAEVTPDAFRALELRDGKAVYAFFKATAVRVAE